MGAQINPNGPTACNPGQRHLRIFPEALRGLGECQRPMSESNKTMTNASVTELVTAVQGRVLKVKYKDGTSELIVGPGVPVTALVVVDRWRSNPE
jgi:hypothetical protein